MCDYMQKPWRDMTKTKQPFIDILGIEDAALAACPGILQAFLGLDGILTPVGEFEAFSPFRENKKRNFKFKVTGGKAGVWKDMGGSEAGKGVVGLYAALSGLGQRDAAEVIGKYLGGDFTFKSGISRLAQQKREPESIKLADLTPFDPSAAAPRIYRKREKGGGFYETTGSWLYKDGDGNGLFFVIRINDDGEKSYRQAYISEGKFKPYGLKGVTPFYRLPELISDADRPVLWVEGEKTADAAASLFPELAAVAGRGGAGNTHMTDPSPLAGRHVYVCGDADDSGETFNARASEAARAAGAASVTLLLPPYGAPDGWDLADPFPAGTDAQGWLQSEIQTHEESPEMTIKEAPDDFDILASVMHEGADDTEIQIEATKADIRTDEDDLIDADTGHFLAPHVESSDVKDSIASLFSPDGMPKWAADGHVGLEYWRTQLGKTEKLSVTKDKKGETHEAWIPIGPAARVTAFAETADGEQHARLVEVINRRGQVSEVLVEDALLSEQSLGALARLFAQAGAPIDPAKPAQLDFARYLLLQNPDAEARIVMKSGWHGSEYLMPDFRPIGSSDMRHLPPAGARKLTGYKPRGTLDGWKEAVRPCAGNTRLIFALCVPLAALLLKETRAENTIFHFHGHSGDGKSTTLRIGASVLGDPDKDTDVVSSWRATDASFEETALTRADSCVFLDELSQSNAATVRDTVFLVGNGKTKAKATSDGAPVGFRIVGLSNGEITLEEKLKEAQGRQIELHEGARARFLDIPSVPKSGTAKGIIERLNGATSSKSLIRKIDDGIFTHHGHAGPAFIERLASDRGALQDAQDLYDETREELARIYSERTGAPATTQEERILSRFALVAAAGRLAVRFEILPFCESEILRAVMSCASDHLSRRGAGEGESSSLEAKFRKFIVQNAMGSFEHLDNSLSDSATRMPTKSYGWVKEGCLFMTRETLAEALGVDPRSTKHAKILAKVGLLLTETDGNKTRYNIRAKLAKGDGDGGRFFAAPYDHIINTGSVSEEVTPIFTIEDIIGFPGIDDEDWTAREAQILRENASKPKEVEET
jgi:uncharacterized protein (DUF927 family)